jgi:hypothetical protein
LLTSGDPISSTSGGEPRDVHPGVLGAHVLQHLEADGKVFELFAHFRADPPAPLPAVRASLLFGLQIVLVLDSIQTVGQPLPPMVVALHAPHPERLTRLLGDGPLVQRHLVHNLAKQD